MFFYLIKKSLKNKSFIFWSLIFPIAIMTCFNFAFSNIYTSENSFDPVKAVYVNEDSVSLNEIFTDFLAENNLLDITNDMMSDKMLKEISELYKAGDFITLGKRFEDGTYTNEKVKESLEPFIERMMDENPELFSLNDLFSEELSLNEVLDNLNISDELLEKLDIASYGLIFNMIADGSGCFELTEADSVEEARDMLVNDDVRMILIVKDKDVRIEMCENYSSMEANIASAFLSAFKTQYQLLRDNFADAFSDSSLNSLSDFDFTMKNIAKQKADIFGETPDPFNWYYYSTIVMGIMFNIITGIGVVADIEADVSKAAMRISLSSSKKSVLLINMFFAKFVICYLISLFEISFANLVFKIPIGNRILQLLLFAAVGNLFTLSIGMLAGLFIKGSVSAKENKANALLMTSVFLSGEMVNTLPALFQEKAPWINEINPASILNFAFYKLVYYENLTGFYINIMKIVLITIICLIIAIIKMRRQKYASV